MPAFAVALMLAASIQPGTPAAAVQRANEQVKTALTRYFHAEGKARTAAREKARAAVGELIDFPALARATMGQKWETLKPAEQKRYTESLRGAMEASYLAKMGKARGEEVSRVTHQILGEEKRGQDVLVKTRVTSGKDGAEIDYLMHREKRGWHAVDVVTEGVSLAETYRDQIVRILPKKGIDGVISALDRRRKQFEAEQDQPAQKTAADPAPAPSGQPR